MKTQSTFLAALSSKTLNQLTTQVAETLAVVTSKKAFTSADLWSIQKQRKAVSIRRFA